MAHGEGDWLVRVLSHVQISDPGHCVGSNCGSHASYNHSMFRRNKSTTLDKRRIESNYKFGEPKSVRWQEGNLFFEPQYFRKCCALCIKEIFLYVRFILKQTFPFVGLEKVDHGSESFTYGGGNIVSVTCCQFPSLVWERSKIGFLQLSMKRTDKHKENISCMYFTDLEISVSFPGLRRFVL